MNKPRMTLDEMVTDLARELPELVYAECNCEANCPHAAFREVIQRHREQNGDSFDEEGFYSLSALVIVTLKATEDLSEDEVVSALWLIKLKSEFDRVIYYAVCYLFDPYGEEWRSKVQLVGGYG